jgi:hypothetical protein
MRRVLFFASLAFIAASQSFAKDSIGEWQTVQQDIPRGWGIEVVTSMTFPCVFERASEEELICTPIQRSGKESDDAEIHLRRDRIREIRVEKRDGANMLASAVGGGGLGSVLGALLVAGARGPSAYMFGLAGTSIGARSGRSLHLLHGKVIYRRPEISKSETHLPSATQTDEEQTSSSSTQTISRIAP